MHDHFMTHGVFSWNELMTTDLDSAKQFYSALFGWTFVETTALDGGTYVVAMDGEKMLGGMMLKPDCVPDHVKPCWDPYVTVDDVDASARLVVEIGGKVLHPPTDLSGVGRFCVVQDPQGVSLNLITYAKKDAE